MDFFRNREVKAERNFANQELRETARKWHDASRASDYQYMFEWLGRPLIQDPQDICAIQELIWRVQPDLVVETGVAHGGSLVLSASILSAISMSEHLAGKPLKSRAVVGVDIEIRPANQRALEGHPLFGMIRLIEGSSVAPDVFAEVVRYAQGAEKTMVILDSNHTADHVYRELELYSSIVSPGSAIFVLDTGIEFAPADSFSVVRSWGPGNSPLTAVRRFLESRRGSDFEIDRSIEKRHLISCAPEGLLIRKQL